MTWRRWLLIASAVCVGALAAAGVAWVLGRISQILWLFAAGFLIAYIFDPLLDRLETRGWSRLRAVLTLTAGILVIAALAAVWLIPSLVTQVQQLGAHWSEYSDALTRSYENTRNWLDAYIVTQFPEWEASEYVDDMFEDGKAWLAEKVPGLVGALGDTLLGSISVVGIAALMTIISIHFMLAIDPFRQSVQRLLPKAATEDVHDISSEVGRMLSQFIRGEATMMLVAGCLATGLMFIVGLIYGTEYALVIGLITGLTYVIPWVGMGGSTVSATVFSYVTADHDPVIAAAAALIAMLAVNQVCDQVFLPRIIGRKVGLHPLVIIFAILAGYQLVGVAGMIVAAPVAASIKIILARWLPIKETDTKSGRAAPLAFDLGATVEMAAGGVGDLAERMRSGVAPESSNQDQAATDSPADGATNQHESRAPTNQEDADSNDRSGTP